MSPSYIKEEVKKKANKILGELQRNLSSCSRYHRQGAYLPYPCETPCGICHPSMVPLYMKRDHHLRIDTATCGPPRVCPISRLPSNQQRQRNDRQTRMGRDSLKVRRDRKDLALSYKIHYSLVDIVFPL